MQLGKFAAVALGLAVDAFELRRIPRGEGGAAQGRDAVDFFLLEGKDGVLGQDAAEGFARFFKKCGLAVVGGEGGFAEKNFAELELGGVDQGEVGFLGDDFAEEFGGFGVEGEGGLFVRIGLAEHFASFRRVDESEEVLTFEDALAAGELLEVGFEGGLGRGVIARLERGDGAAEISGLEFARAWIFRDEGIVLFDRFFVFAFAGWVFRFERCGEARQGLRLEESGEFGQFRGRGRTREKLLERIEGLLVFPGEEVGKGELDLGVGDNGGRRIVGEDFFVCGDRSRIVAVGVDRIGGFEGLLRCVLGGGAGNKEDGGQE